MTKRKYLAGFLFEKSMSSYPSPDTYRALSNTWTRCAELTAP